MSQYCKDCKHRTRTFGIDYCEASGEPYRDHVSGKQQPGAPRQCGFHRQGALCNDFAQKPSMAQRIKALLVT